MKINPFIQSLIIFLLLLCAATGIGYLFSYAGFPETNIVIVYILTVIITAMFTPVYLFDIVTSLTATLTFNFFFTEPYFSFAVNDPSYIVTFVIMTATAMITSALAARAKKSVLEAQEKEAESSALYMLTNRLTKASDIESIAYIAVATISDVMNCHAGCLCFNGTGSKEPVYIQQNESGKPMRRDITDLTQIMKRIDDLRTTCDINDEFYDFPVYGKDSTLGIIRIPAPRAKELSEKQWRILTSMIENTALAMDRQHIAGEQMKAFEETQQERYRANLLRAISHDLRTPLAGILGSSNVLSDVAGSKETVIRIAEDIYQEADWLHSLVENILNLTRIQDGKLLPQKEPEAVEEIVGFAVETISRRYPSAEIAVFAPEELLVVPMDARLISQVLINLLDNAVKHAKQDKKGVTVNIAKEKGNARFTVSDEGPGIQEEELPKIFEMFYPAGKTRGDAQHGIGLGLTICKAIVNAHGGEITARNRTDKKGAEIEFTLPIS